MYFPYQLPIFYQPQHVRRQKDRELHGSLQPGRSHRIRRIRISLDLHRPGDEADVCGKDRPGQKVLEEDLVSEIQQESSRRGGPLVTSLSPQPGVSAGGVLRRGESLLDVRDGV